MNKNNPHPYAEMICQWARTGQPVWVRPKKPYEFKISDYENHPTTKLMVDDKGVYFITTTPDWNIPGAEYSFTSFCVETSIKPKSNHLFDYDPSSPNGYD